MDIDVELSAKSIENAIKRIKQYQEDLKAKNAEFLTRLWQIGVSVIDSVMAEVPAEQRGTYNVLPSEAEQDGSVTKLAIELSGDKVLFIEFSAGITYGTSEYPTAQGESLGYGMGTFNPQSPNWSDPDGWWYASNHGFVHTFGNKAYMPMYHADEAIRKQVIEIAREVFGA